MAKGKAKGKFQARESKAHGGEVMEMKPGDKYCPIDTHPWEIDSLCKKEKCAWWHILNIQTKKGQCSLLTLAVALHWISVKPKRCTIEVKDG